MKKLYFLMLYFSLAITSFGYSFTNSIATNTTLSVPPGVDFSFANDNSCSGTLITFISAVNGNGPFQYSWNFGDGKTSSSSNPSHTFEALGCGTQNFTIKLTVTDVNGEASTIAKTITVKQKPNLRFINLDNSGTSFEKCGDSQNPKYTINVGNISNSVSCIKSYVVDWGDGSLENNITFPKTHAYLKLGSYKMVITGVGANGCNNSVTYIVNNSTSPKGALITPGNTTNLCLPVDTMEFEIVSWGSNPSDTQYEINFGDGTIEKYSQKDMESSIQYNSANPSASLNFPVLHQFTKANCPLGNTINLNIITTCGRSTFTVGPVIILDVPKVDFAINAILCSNTPIIFINKSSAGYGNNCGAAGVYTWDFGDGNISNEGSPEHIYSTPGTYTIKLTAKTPCGAAKEVTKTVCVEPVLQPQFTYSNACVLKDVIITNNTDASQGCSIESYNWEVVKYSEEFCGGSAAWNFVNGTNASSKNPVFNFANPGTYYVKLTTRNACGIFQSVTEMIQVKKTPVITLNPIPDYCNSISINPVATVDQNCSPGSEISYLWSFPGATPSSSTSLNPGAVNYANSGNYTVTFSVTNSCGTTTKTVPFSVALTLKPIISSKTVKVCSKNTFQVTPVTNTTENVPIGTTYVWSEPIISPAGSVSGASAQSSPKDNISQTLVSNIDSPATVTYTVTPMSKACTGANFTITVTVDPLIEVIETVKNSTCFGANNGSIDLIVDAGIPFINVNPYAFLWTGPDGFTSTNEDISGLKPGDYVLNVTDNGNCPFTKTYNVAEPELFQFSAIKNDISCFGLNDGNIRLSVKGGTQPYTYEWKKNGNPYPETVEYIDNLKPGTYDVIITEVNNCNLLKGTYTIEEPPVLKVNLTKQMNIFCYGYSTGEIEINTVGGIPIETSSGVFDYNYSWTGPNGFTSNLQNLKNLAVGTYNLIVTDKSGCTDHLQVILTQNAEIVFNYTKSEISCFNSANASVSIDNIKGGVPFTTGDPYSVKWSNLGTGLTQNNLSAGSYTITITDSLGCSKESSLIIENAPVFSIKPDIKDISCFGAKDGYIHLNLLGGKAPITLVWDDNPSAGIERNNIGPGKYSVTITDSKSCVIKETFTISEPSLLKLNADVSNPLDCADANTGIINLIVTGGKAPFTYEWSNGAKTEDLNKIPPGTYQVTVTDVNGCKKSGEWKITRFEELTPTIEVKTDLNCETKYINQTYIGHVKGGVPPYRLSWSDGIVTGDNNEIMNTNKEGLITFSVTDSFGCTATIPYNVKKTVLGIANYTTGSYTKDVYDTYSVYDPILFTNLATGDFINTSWEFGDGNFSNEVNPKHIYTREGTRAVTQTVTYSFGCQYKYTSTLIITKGYSIMMPNSFTPNNDGYNDVFTPVFTGLEDISLIIFDNWGGVVYTETGKNISGWNGKIKDVDAQSGNYYFMLTGKTFYNHTVTEKGAFTLIK
ncbi:PKD domain-containing protein [Flavobacterium sp. UGB4466]|uniref:PKD domain-containing protein n=1 Tax=Flavobacterium sp. UGB4466 TaxID=2730889 RepID=UPI001ED97314|nr:PKD domain-containing protein [Flavobacterium sp. UGB4466]